jgi:ABC-type transport system involved in cytochrome bd biosynthesis fused ATPase/permease subunit
VGEVFGVAEAALTWQADGVRLPTATALALALAPEGADRSERLPISMEEGGRWLAERPWAQRVLRAVDARTAADWESKGDVVIQASGVWQRYVAPATSTLALHDVALSVSEGELVAIVGANGSGKTSLLRTLTGLLVPERGEVAIAGVNLRRASARQVAGLVAHVFQNPEAGFLADTVEDELAYGPRALGWSESEISRHTRARFSIVLDWHPSPARTRSR